MICAPRCSPARSPGRLAATAGQGRDLPQRYQAYKEKGAPTSIGERLEFWRKSLHFFAEAPVIGHGTGSTEGLFEQAATGQTGWPPPRSSAIRITRP